MSYDLTGLPIEIRFHIYRYVEHAMIRDKFKNVMDQIMEVFDWNDPEQVSFKEEYETYSQAPQHHDDGEYDFVSDIIM